VSLWKIAAFVKFIVLVVHVGLVAAVTITAAAAAAVVVLVVVV